MPLPTMSKALNSKGQKLSRLHIYALFLNALNCMMYDVKMYDFCFERILPCDFRIFGLFMTMRFCILPDVFDFPTISLV